MGRLTFPCLAVITDRTLLSPNWTLAQAIAPAVTGGANLVILRETDLPSTPRMAVARFVADGVRGRAAWIVSGSPEFALQAQADGVLLEEEEPDVEAARHALGTTAIVGVAASSLEHVSRDEAADFILLNLDWSGSNEALKTLTAYRRNYAGPLVVGIDPPADHIVAIMQAGAAGIAIMKPAMAAENRASVMSDCQNAMNSAGSVARVFLLVPTADEL